MPSKVARIALSRHARCNVHITYHQTIWLSLPRHSLFLIYFRLSLFPTVGWGSLCVCFYVHEEYVYKTSLVRLFDGSELICFWQFWFRCVFLSFARSRSLHLLQYIEAARQLFNFINLTAPHYTYEISIFLVAADLLFFFSAGLLNDAKAFQSTRCGTYYLTSWFNNTKLIHFGTHKHLTNQFEKQQTFWQR